MGDAASPSVGLGCIVPVCAIGEAVDKRDAAPVADPAPLTEAPPVAVATENDAADEAEGRLVTVAAWLALPRAEPDAELEDELVRVPPPPPPPPRSTIGVVVLVLHPLEKADTEEDPEVLGERDGDPVSLTVGDSVDEAGADLEPDGDGVPKGPTDCVAPVQLEEVLPENEGLLDSESDK